jgi:putative CocE/NonD family hydrolase
VSGLRLLAFILCLAVTHQSNGFEAQSAKANETPGNRLFEGTLPSGAAWSAKVPRNWNGTLLLYSHGYSPTLRPPDLAPRDLEQRLLDAGYALAASAYAQPGWALAEAVPDQIATLDAFAERFGRAKRTIAWGPSMGGLVTVALAERFPSRLDGALPSCGSLAGALGMMNEALDGAFAFKVLLAPQSDIRVIRVDDDRANGERVAHVLAGAMGTPDGRARVALASALAQLPTWSGANPTRPGETETERQLDEAAATFVMGVFLPRVDQERRAGGVYSWNTGVDYRAQLAKSGRENWVKALYSKAGLNLDRDLKALNAEPRIEADPNAVAYMRANYVPSGRLQIPVLSYHTIGDGLTANEQQGAYRDLAQKEGSGSQLAVAWVNRSRHCSFTSSENLAALKTLEDRLNTGHWHASPAEMNAAAASEKFDGSDFVSFTPAAFSRTCSASPGSCLGEPVPAAKQSRSESAAQSPITDIIKASQYVSVEDGTRLAIDIYRPAQMGRAVEDRLPVVLLHSIGNRSDSRTLSSYGISDLVKHGYVFVWLQPRGIGASFGKTGGFLTEQNGRDVRDVIGWLSRQPWSNGKIGMMGLSNLGFIQWLAATVRPHGLVTIVPAVANPDFYYQLYPNGTSALAGAPGTARRGGAPPPAGPQPLKQPVDEDPAPDYPLWAAAQKSHAGGLTLPDAWLVNMMRDQVNPLLGYAPGLVDSPLPSFAAALRTSNIRIYQMGGWADASPGGQIIAHRGFGTKLIIGNWPHVLMTEDQGGPLLRAEHLRWFDYTLKGIDNGIEKEMPVRYQVQNIRSGDGWRFAPSFPLPDQRLTAFYFAGGPANALNSSNDGRLTPLEPGGVMAFDTYREVFDIAAFGGTYNRLKRSWDGDMTTDVDRRALTYTTSTLERDTEVTGFPVAHVWLSADAADSDLVVYLEDVSSDGHSHFVTDGAARASHRRLEERAPWSEMKIPFHRSFSADRELLVVGQPVLVSFALTPTSYLFHRGSRIRFTLTSGEQNTYQPAAEIDTSHPPTLHIYRDRKRASRIDLPLIKPVRNPQ